MRWRAEVNKHLGVRSELVFPDEIARLCPEINLADDVRFPVLAALYHPPGAIARHDAVAWGYAMGAAKLGVEIHQQTEVTGIETECRPRHRRARPIAGASPPGRCCRRWRAIRSPVAAMAGLRLPIRTVPLQACVSEPLKPILDKIVVSGSLHIYISQSARGEFVMGGATDPYALYAARSTLDFKEALTGDLLELFPFLAKARIVRQWAGIADMTPDFSPVMGLTPIGNYYIDAGWGTWGFKATPISGKTMAATIATGVPDPLIESFRLDRFSRFDQVGERGAASVGH